MNALADAHGAADGRAAASRRRAAGAAATAAPVVVRLRGGLGNQMFQYAAAAAVARRHGGEVLLDLREPLPGRGQPHLLRWRVAARPLDATTAPLLLRHATPVLALARRQRWFARLAGCHVERGLRFDASLHAGRPPLLLDGYFQSERCFADPAAAADAHAARRTLLREFTPRAALGAAARRVAADIAAAGNAIGLHVRRGDYASVAANRAVHGVCDAAYYAAAARLVAARTGTARPRIFVFGDDPAWARAALRLPGDVVHVEPDADAPEVDLLLMSLCRHHVCANSTFGWWGAWLGQRLGQVVVAPARWFTAPGLDATDIVPARWLRL